MEGRQNVRETCVASDYGEQCIHIQRHQHPKQVDLFGLAVDVSVAQLKGYKTNTKRVMGEERHRVRGRVDLQVEALKRSPFVLHDSGDALPKVRCWVWLGLGDHFHSPPH